MSERLIRNQREHFNGFSSETLDFLRKLKQNNNKVWFETHRQDYQQYVLEPMRYLVIGLGEFMLKIDPHFDITPAINRTISRIHRDTRFSRDKSPYKSTLWITFKRPGKQWKDAPGYFFEMSADSYRYGMGFYSASPETMHRFREIIDTKPTEFREVTKFYSYQSIFVIEGEKYKRLSDKKKSDEVQTWYQRKNLYLVCNNEIDNHFFDKVLVSDLVTGFDLIAPFYHYLWRIIAD
jgi:uncharacterized protein (TIGR02453 family)